MSALHKLLAALSFPKVFKAVSKLGSLITFLAFAAIWSGQEGPLSQVTRLMSSVANVGESASRAASAILDTGADFTSSASSAMLAISGTTYDAASAAWSGIDLLDLRCSKTIGRITADDGNLLAAWLNSSTGLAATKCAHASARELWSSLATSIGVAMPQAQASTEKLTSSGHFWQASGKAVLLASGYTALEFSCVEVTFVPQWANPVWAAFELNVTSEYQQIANYVDTFIQAAPAANLSWGPLSDESLATMSLPVRMTAKLKYVSRAVYLVFRCFLAELSSLWGGGIVLAAILFWAYHASSQARFIISQMADLLMPTKLANMLGIESTELGWGFIK